MTRWEATTVLDIGAYVCGLAVLAAAVVIVLHTPFWRTFAAVIVANALIRRFTTG